MTIVAHIVHTFEYPELQGGPKITDNTNLDDKFDVNRSKNGFGYIMQAIANKCNPILQARGQCAKPCMACGNFCPKFPQALNR